MNTLRRIPRQTPQCLRQFATSSQPQRPAGLHSAFLDSMDPTKQAEAQPPGPSTTSPNSDLQRLLEGTRQGIAKPDATRQRFSAPTGRPSEASHTRAMEELAKAGGERAVLNQMPRKWKEGDIYAPHDLTIGEAKKWKQIVRRPEKDCFDMLGKNPMLFYKVFEVPETGTAHSNQWLMSEN